MASFASVHVSATKKTIVPWSVVSLDPTQTFGELFSAYSSGKVCCSQNLNWTSSSCSQGLQRHAAWVFV